MRQCKCFLFLFFASGFPSLLSAQDPDDKIDPNHFNIQYLEFLVKTKIDSIRSENGLYTLIDDSILYLAARHHSDYLVKERTMGHNEKKKKFSTPQKRVTHYGGLDYFAGENVVSIPILVPCRSKRIKKTHINETYEDAANEMVVAWVRSKRHYQNMKYPKYQVTGVALTYDRATNTIKCVQVFAEVKSKFVFPENTRMFKYAEPDTMDYALEYMDQVSRRQHKGRHEWNLKIPKKRYRRCRECGTIYAMKDDLDFYVDTNGYVHATCSNNALTKRLTRRWKDGLALESVDYTDYECGNKNYFLRPSRRNGECIANGKVRKPLYKWKMRKEWRHQHRIFRRWKRQTIFNDIISFQFKKKYPQIPEVLFKKFPQWPIENDWKLGKLPKNDSAYYELDVMILRHKRVCGIIHFTDFCGAPFEKITPLSYISDLSDKPFVYPEDTLQYSFTVPFEKNKFDYHIEDIAPLIDSLSLKDNRIVGIKVSAYASVEGTFEKNKELAEKRSASIIAVLKSLQKDSVTQLVQVEEDWKGFFERLKTTRYASWSAMKKEDIKKQLAIDSISFNLENILAKERRAVIHICYMPTVSFDERLLAAQKQYREMLDSLSLFKNPPTRVVQRLLVRQTFLYKQVLEGHCDTSFLFLPILQNHACNQLLCNQFYFKIKYRNILEDTLHKEVWYDELKEQALYKGSRSAAKYNLMVYLLDKWGKDRELDSDTLTDPNWMLHELNLIRPGEVNADSLKYLYLNYYFKTAAWCLAKDTFTDLHNSCVNHIYHYYSAHHMPDTLALRMARFFIWHGQEKRALNLLRPYALKKDPNHELLALFLKMSYVHLDQDSKAKFNKWMLNAANILTPEEYAHLITGPCNMSFQVLDNEKIRKVYCEKTSGHSNFALDYKEEKRKEHELQKQHKQMHK